MTVVAHVVCGNCETAIAVFPAVLQAAMPSDIDEQVNARFGIAAADEAWGVAIADGHGRYACPACGAAGFAASAPPG